MCVGALAGLCLMLASASGRANTDKLTLHLRIGSGWAEGSNAGGVLFDTTALGAYEFLRAGIAAQCATTLVTGTLGLGGTTGVGMELDRVQVTLLGEGGLHAYGGVGSSFLSDDPGASATLGYAGGRFALGYRVGGWRDANVAITTFGFWNRDLKTVERSYAYEIPASTGWLSGDYYPAETGHATHTVGPSQWGLGLGASMELGR